MIKEERIITRNNLKQLCIDFDLYTLGTSEEYEERNIMITAFLIGALLFLAAFMINIYIIRRF